MTQQNLGERVATLEAENAMATPLHEQFRVDIADLKDGVARIETKVELLVTNGNHHTSKLRAVFPYGSAVSFLGGLAAVLKFLG